MLSKSAKQSSNSKSIACFIKMLKGSFSRASFHWAAGHPEVKWSSDTQNLALLVSLFCIIYTDIHVLLVQA